MLNAELYSSILNIVKIFMNRQNLFFELKMKLDECLHHPSILNNSITNKYDRGILV